HQPVPDLARGTELGNLLKKVIMAVEEEAQPGAEIVYVQPAAARPFHVLHAVINGECQLLERRGTSFADVVSADGDGVEPGREPGAKLKCVNHQAHGWSG